MGQQPNAPYRQFPEQAFGVGPREWAQQVEQDFGRLAREHVARVMRRVLRHRERYLRAWFAATGLTPEQSELHEYHRPDGSSIVRVQRRGSGGVVLDVPEPDRERAQHLARKVLETSDGLAAGVPEHLLPMFAHARALARLVLRAK